MGCEVFPQTDCVTMCCRRVNQLGNWCFQPRNKYRTCRAKSPFAPPPVGTFVSVGGDQVVYNATIVLAVGTWDLSGIGIDTNDVNLGANVYNSVNDNDPDIASADVEVFENVELIPEPASLLLACFGLIGVVTRRRSL